MDFILKEWILTASAAGFVLTSAYIGHPPDFSIPEMEVLFILLALFVSVRGLQCSGLFSACAQHMEKTRLVFPALVMTTFFLSMLVTNDAALMAVVPLTLAMQVRRRDVLVILEALAANAGSALTPFGNPQNLFLYWFYNLHPAVFVSTIMPFSLVFLVLLLAGALALNARLPATLPAAVKTSMGPLTWSYLALLAVVLMTILHILPVYAVLLVLVFAMMRDRRALRVDYALLLSFLFLFGLAENIRILLASEIVHPEHVFLLSAMASQVMSNVPATLLFAKLTPNWEALLWGVSTGGFGSLFGSMANLIAYRLYVMHDSTDNPALFTLKFLLMGYMAFFLAIGLYFALHSAGVLLS